MLCTETCRWRYGGSLHQDLGSHGAAWIITSPTQWWTLYNLGLKEDPSIQLTTTTPKTDVIWIQDINLEAPSLQGVYNQRWCTPIDFPLLFQWMGTGWGIGLVWKQHKSFQWRTERLRRCTRVMPISECSLVIDVLNTNVGISIASFESFVDCTSGETTEEPKT